MNKRFRALALVFIGLVSTLAGAQTTPTATVNALIDQSCAGTRANSNLVCSANDFTVGVNFTQPAASAIQNCVAGEYITVNVIASLSSGSPNRYDAGIFFGQNGLSPSLNNAANQCSLGVFPATPTPFFTADTDVCGDYQGSSTATLQITSIKLLCTPAPGTNLISIPYLIAWDNQVSGSSCTAANLTAGNNSKCVASTASGVTGLVARGYVTITKATNPVSSTQSFSFSASTPATSPVAALNTTSFALSNGQTQTVTVPLSDTGGTRTLVIDEALAGGWESDAVITCTSPSGGSAASYVTIDNANRRVTAALTATNPSARCTYTNNKQTRVRVTKAVAPTGATGVFNLSTTSNLGTSSATDQATGGATTYQPSTRGLAVTVTESAGASTTLTDYVSTVACTSLDSGTAVVPSSTSLTGGTSRNAVLTPPFYGDTSCTFTNTRSANLSVTKTNSVTTLLAGQSTTYVITVSNAGPSSAHNTVLTDPAAVGLNCTAVQCIATTGGATCPATVNIATLQGSGLVLGNFPSNSSASFAVTCGVTATGL
jgi:uncharacterized repeat protein (TIGR01451 family)